jgi:putative SOS response-associated peptidase YedK
MIGGSQFRNNIRSHLPEESLKIYPVSDLVNSPKTDDARCIEPVRIDRDFFERQWWGDE